MNRLVALALGAILLLGTAVPALAGSPNDSCPAAQAGFELVDLQGWWDNTVDGFETEGIQVYVDGDPLNGFTEEFDDFAISAGFADGQALYDLIWGAQWDTINKNGDSYVCMKAYPRTPGNPAYLFAGVDNSAR